MIIKELKDFIFENYSQRMEFANGKSYSMKDLNKKGFIIVCMQINRKNN